MSTTTSEEKEVIGKIINIKRHTSGNSVRFKVKPDNNDKNLDAEIHNDQAEIDLALNYNQVRDAARQLTTAENYNRWAENLSIANNTPGSKIKVTFQGETVVTNVELVDRV